MLKFELDPAPESFTPHPLFRQGGSQSVVPELSPARISTQTKTESLGRSVLERIRSKVLPYLPVGHKESPLSIGTSSREVTVGWNGNLVD